MITVASAAAALLFATGQTAPQTPPAQPAPGADITSSLNSGPPRAATYLAPAPAPVVTAPPATAPAATPPATRPAAVTPAPTTTPPPTAAPTRPATPPATRPAAVTPAPATATPPASAPTRPAPTRPTTPPATTTPAATTPAPAPVVAPPPPSAPAVTVLDAAARAALPFSIDLPAGFEIVTGRPGPDFKIYTIRRGDRSFAMVYAGPASQFPIYTGEVLEAGGRATVVSTEDGVRHAREHLFQRDGATPREIHVWTMSLDGADRALAERIAQSLDVR